EETVRTYPTGSDVNPLDNHLVKVTVQSDYYIGWGRYFEDRTDGEVEYDHSRNIVNLTLVSPISQGKVPAGVTSLAASGSLVLDGASANPCAGPGKKPRPYADSYNSSGTSNDYCTQKSNGNTKSNGNITYGESIDIDAGSGTSDIEGSLRSGGDVFVSKSKGKGQPDVNGDIYYTDNCNPSELICKDRASGVVEPINDGLTTASPITWHIDTTVDEIESSNDNGGAPISNKRLDFGPSNTVTLTEGKYFLNRIDFTGGPNPSGDTLNIDTSSGDVTVVVRDYVDVGSNEISVSGGNTTNIYIAGESTTGGDMLSINGGDVLVADDNSPNLRVFGQPDFNITVDDGHFTGVLYAPPGPSGTGELVLRNDGHVIGGAVIGDTTIETQGSVHYDEALKNERIVSRNAKVLKITYLHVSVNEIRVS
ncbi:MAG: hypothetical protein V5A54_06365, partial [Haloarculaceae archaeon]